MPSWGRMSRVATDDLLKLSLVWQRQFIIAIFYKLFPMPFQNELYLMGIQPTVCREHMRWANICPDVLAKWWPPKNWAASGNNPSGL